MYAQKLKEVFDVYYKAPIHAWEEFSNHCEKVFYKKEEVIKRANQKEKQLFFLLTIVLTGTATERYVLL